MLSTLRRRRKAGDRGVALIEFALVLPLLALITFGVLDLSRAYQLQNRLRNAAREGASFAQYFPEKRVAACGTGIGDSIEEKSTNEDEELGGVDGFDVRSFRIDSGGSETEYSTCQTQSTFSAGDRVRVEVSAKYEILTPLIAAVTGQSTYTLTGSSQVRVQK